MEDFTFLEMQIFPNFRPTDQAKKLIEKEIFLFNYRFYSELKFSLFAVPDC